MKIRKLLLSALLIAMLVAAMIPQAALAEGEVPAFDGEISREVTNLFDGVDMVHVSLGAKSKYGQNEFWYIIFDPTRPDLAVNVTNEKQYATQLSTVKKTVEAFNNNHADMTPIAAINGDLWMVTYAHARVEGSGTNYNGYKNAVVTGSLTLPRGLDIYDGEIISSPHSTQETPYEGQFHSFGITPDGRTVLGSPSLTISVTDETINGDAIKVTGLNRLPADKAIYVYSDKGCESNKSLDDAYEIVIDCDYDYKITSGCEITGKVTAICKEGDENPKMQENRLILCARGTKQKASLEDIKIGDTLKFNFTIKGSKNDNDIWQEVTNAVGGHMPLVTNGKNTKLGDSTRYPTSIIGNMPDGKIIFFTVDGRQPDYSVGFKISDMGEILLNIGVQNAFLLDGGGSATMVNSDKNGNYEVTNHPCDKDSNGNFGQERTVVNSIILSYITPATPEPTAEPTPESTEAPQNTSDSSSKPSSGCGSIISGSAIAVLLAAAAILKKRK